MASHFLITIDVEGDNVWTKPKQVETENAAYMPRFQALCEKYGLRPTYLTNHEMAMSPVYREFAQDVAARNVGEIGMHLHAWDSPPFEPLSADDSQHQPYLIDYPESTIRKKVRVMTDILESMVGTEDAEPSSRAVGIQRAIRPRACRLRLCRRLFGDTTYILARHAWRAERIWRVRLQSRPRDSLFHRSC
jgi:hypothetical protein